MKAPSEAGLMANDALCGFPSSGFFRLTAEAGRAFLSVASGSFRIKKERHFHNFLLSCRWAYPVLLEGAQHFQMRCK
jgi:hypothetical protein